ncbi:sensor histidine kinase [Breznakiella homolactica]|uniref:histidine kinase n=1 Tax=Breznakiella homolactica TaxID=2798577 RepID=A0A7T7XM09_9SPIR|nr:HAMP domain-containing sensor histidine kinase [Breznakiella homolactica]QQO08727.1 HAMP domain-containing histidine kinase [Breznakiella homolactica]
MKNIFTRIFSGQITAVLAVFLIMTVIFIFAVRVSIESWNTDKKADLENLLFPVLSKVYRLRGGFSPAELEAALLPYMTDSLYVFVFDEQKKPMILLNEGKRISPAEMERRMGPMQTFLALNPPRVIEDNGIPVGYFSVDNADFLAYRANRIFLSTMIKAALAGGSAAVLLALGISLLISSVFSKQAAALAGDIVSISGDGQRPPSVAAETHEFAVIVRSAEQLRERLEREESLRRQWMQDISHDLRTPVAAVKAQLEAMADGVLDTGRSRLAALLAELGHIEQLVMSLQELSRYESPEMKIIPADIIAAQFVTETCRGFKFLAMQRNIRFRCSAPEDTVFSADAYLLQRCVSNMVKNALQYTEPGGLVTVDLREDRGRIIFEVANTGYLSPRDESHMFDRLYRGNAARSEGGSGLGLSIAKAIAGLHHGTISGGNRDEMVCFTLSIPVSQSGSL